ncbi:hypothetical protein [Stackebrandtia soli]|uniref:hypothetical protein n=1 Tax=Stackebrandtia soli TaxID=1892856 RepID=UPI0039ED1B51
MDDLRLSSINYPVWFRAMASFYPGLFALAGGHVIVMSPFVGLSLVAVGVIAVAGVWRSRVALSTDLLFVRRPHRTVRLRASDVRGLSLRWMRSYPPAMRRPMWRYAVVYPCLNVHADEFRVSVPLAGWGGLMSAADLDVLAAFVDKTGVVERGEISGELRRLRRDPQTKDLAW